jgi:hypothetical protein
MFFSDFVGDAGWKRLEANVITCPTRMLDGRSLAAATGATRRSPQFVAGGLRPPQDDGDSASERSVVLTTLAPKPDPRRCSM